FKAHGPLVARLCAVRSQPAWSVPVPPRREKNKGSCRGRGEDSLSLVRFLPGRERSYLREKITRHLACPSVRLVPWLSRHRRNALSYNTPKRAYRRYRCRGASPVLLPPA